MSQEVSEPAEADVEVDEPAQAPLLSAPAAGLPPVTETAHALVADTERFAAGHGPVALDTERAGGHRYSQRAYLVQARRRGAGTSLIDPIACPDLSGLAAAIDDAEWVLHAASQDLPALTEIGMTPGPSQIDGYFCYQTYYSQSCSGANCSIGAWFYNPCQGTSFYGVSTFAMPTTVSFTDTWDNQCAALEARSQ